MIIIFKKYFYRNKLKQVGIFILFTSNHYVLDLQNQVPLDGIYILKHYVTPQNPNFEIVGFYIFPTSSDRK